MKNQGPRKRVGRERGATRIRRGEMSAKKGPSGERREKREGKHEFSCSTENNAGKGGFEGTRERTKTTEMVKNS